ncbi:conserved hypothetical protein [Magnetospirillum sp. UT-4]|nr:conserved hypothetical protein [Magnetospirillum sp. UT-4]
MYCQSNGGCYYSLLNAGRLAEHRDARDIRNVIDLALSCDRTLHCGKRLECAWMASELAERLGRGLAE